MHDCHMKSVNCFGKVALYMEVRHVIAKRCFWQIVYGFNCQHMGKKYKMEMH